MRFVPALLAVMTLSLAVVPAAALRAVERPQKAERQRPADQPYLEILLKDYMTYREDVLRGNAVLRNGERLKNPINLVFLHDGVKIAPAGDNTPGTGHFHLLVDSTLTSEELKQPIPSDEQHIHYGKGQTEATVTLPPGKHTLQLLLGDGNHVPHDPPIMSAPVTVIVE